MRIFRIIGQDVRGATAIEYGLIVGLIVIVIIVGIGGVADKTIRMWDYVARHVTQA